MLNKEILATAERDLGKLHTVMLTTHGAAAQGAYMDYDTGTGLYNAMCALNRLPDPCEDSLAVIGWALAKLAQGKLGNLIAENS